MRYNAENVHFEQKWQIMPKKKKKKKKWNKLFIEYN